MTRLYSLRTHKKLVRLIANDGLSQRHRHDDAEVGAIVIG